jgi:hypothetical protein
MRAFVLCIEVSDGAKEVNMSKNYPSIYLDEGMEFFLINILCLEVSEGTRGFEYVKNCVDNPHFKKIVQLFG